MLPGVALCLVAGLASTSAQTPPVHLSVVGGLANVSQYVKLEEPFWATEIGKLSGGRITADIHPFDRSGLPGEDMLQLMQLGVVPFGTALLAVVSGDEPELNAVDLPALNPNMASLHRTVAAYRPQLQAILHDKFNVELLGVYTYPAQVLFCAAPFTGLNDISGRRVRTSSVGQSEMMTALGAIPVQTPFAEMVPAIRSGAVDCAVTGTLSGNEVGLSDVTTHVSALAISWGLSIFAANEAAWNTLPPDLREVVKQGIGSLEQRIWDAADHETALGLACDTGATSCTSGHPSHMTLVPVSAQDEATRKRLLTETVIPDWVQRCGSECVKAWNRTLGPALGINAVSH